jgi:hypothetical protein
MHCMHCQREIHWNHRGWTHIKRSLESWFSDHAARPAWTAEW